MPLFQKKGKFVSVIPEDPFLVEREIHTLTEQNLKEIFNLKFVAREFTYNNLRIDTLAFNETDNSFVVIEYKRDKNFSVMDQGFAYLSLVLNNQAEFVLAYNMKFEKSCGRDDFDWSQIKVIFVAKSFTNHQLEAINFKDLPIELWEISRYKGEIIEYTQIKKQGTKASINTIAKPNSEFKKISETLKTSLESDYLSKLNQDSEGYKIYQSLKEKLLEIDANFIIHPTRGYLGLRIEGKNNNIVAFHVNKLDVRIDFTTSEPKDFSDPDHKVKYVENSMKYWNQHVSTMNVKSEKEIDYAVFLIRQKHERFLARKSL